MAYHAGMRWSSSIFNRPGHPFYACPISISAVILRASLLLSSSKLGGGGEGGIVGRELAVIDRMEQVQDGDQIFLLL